MSALTKDRTIGFLNDVPGITPVAENYLEKWQIKSFYHKRSGNSNYLSPNRRDFYKVMFMLEAQGVFTIGTKTYAIGGPTVMFIPPSEIISWKGVNRERETYYCLLKKSFIEEQPSLKAIIDKYPFFTDPDRHVLTLDQQDMRPVKTLFDHLIEEEIPGNPLAEDMMQADLQLIILTCAKLKNHLPGLAADDNFKHIHHFFSLLEKEMLNIHQSEPIKTKTAQEFADLLAITPNYLNTLLKKYTGQNVSTHIRNRLLDESKMLLLYTDWTLQEIGYALGFSDQPNFSTFFKKLSGSTPADFRKSNVYATTDVSLLQ